MLQQYIKSFWLSAKRNRFFHFINLIGFTSGFLLLTIIFTYIYQEISFDRFHQNRANIYRIHSGGYGVTPLCFGDKLRGKIPEISEIVRFSSTNPTLMRNNQKIKLDKMYYADKELFNVFSFHLIAGNAATALNAPFSLVFSQSAATRIFGKPLPIGETIQDKDGRIYTITGIMSDIPFNSHIQSDAFVSIETLRQLEGDEAFNCGSWGNLTYINLVENANLKATELKINSLLDDSKMTTSDGKISLKLEPLTKIYFDPDNNKFDGTKHGNAQTVLLYFVIAIMLILIVIINYINLSTAIAGSRIREISIRKINGATRGQIIKQIVFEAMFLAILSFIIAVIFVELLMPQLSGLLNIPVSKSLETMYLYPFLFLGVTIIGAITGLFPAVFLSGISEIKALKNETVFSSRGVLRSVLILFQLVVVAVLLNSTFVINKQIAFCFEKEIGLDYQNVMTFELNKPLQEKCELLKSNLLNDNEIQSVSYSDGAIGIGLTKHPVGIGEVSKLCNFISVDPDYLPLYDIKLKYGRNFSPDLVTDASKSCILNEAACKEFGIENPLGMSLGNGITIVGVVRDYNYATLHNKIEPLVLSCGNGRVAQVKIASENRKATIGSIISSCKTISPEFDGNYNFVDDQLKKLYKSEFDLKASFTIYAIIMFLIALLGLFATMLFALKKKQKEVVIRVLYGATINNTLFLFAKTYIAIVVVANLIALPITIVVMQKWLENFQYHVEIGAMVFVKTLILTIVFTLSAVFLVVRNAHRINIIQSLKNE